MAPGDFGVQLKTINVSFAVNRRPIGLFGAGAFGELCLRQLGAFFDIWVHDPSPTARHLVRRYSANLVSMEQAASCPIVILAVPIPALKKLARTIAPHVKKGAIVLDVASVKVRPAEWLQDAIPDHADIICTHPLFGPQSASSGLAGLEVVVCPVRTERAYRVVRFLERALQLKVSVTTPQAHDEVLATVQGLTHLLAQAMSRLEPLPSEHTTTSYELVMRGLSLVRNDSDELFLSIMRDNPFAAEVRRRFFAEMQALGRRLDAALEP